MRADLRKKGRSRWTYMAERHVGDYCPALNLHVQEEGFFFIGCIDKNAYLICVCMIVSILIPKKAGTF